MLHKMRQRVEDERGFTLIELLVVILIIGILAAIAIPSFLSQKDKAGDASAKSYVRNAETAQETYFTDNGAYATRIDTLQGIEQSLNDLGKNTAPTAGLSGTRGFFVSVMSGAGVTYTITRADNGAVTRSCDKPSVGGCKSDRTW